MILPEFLVAGRCNGIVRIEVVGMVSGLRKTEDDRRLLRAVIKDF